MLARKAPGRVRRAAGVSLVAALAVGVGLAAWAAQPASPVYVSERAVSDSPTPQPTPAPSELPGDWKAHLKLMAELMMAYRDRVIPLDHIIEASVTAETRNGEVLGPYRMYSSLPNDMRSSEFANGDKGFNADGDDRFIGAVLGSADADGGLTLDFGLVIDGDPIVVERLKVQSGASATVEKNGLKLTIHPVLRPMTDAELKRRIPGRTGPVKAKLQENPPAPVPQPQSPASGFSDMTITCNNWNGRHSQDPKVHWANVNNNAPVVLTLESDASSATFPDSAFPADAYPLGQSEKGLGLRTDDRFVYQSISSSVIDTITVDGLKTGDLRAVWQRFRIDAEGAHPIALQGRCTRN